MNDLGDGVFCIDTDYQRPGLAACYLLKEGDRLAFVDTGTALALPRLLEAVAELGLTPDQVDYVIPTHVHLDHGGGAGDLMAVCPQATLVAHPNAAPHLIDPSRLKAGATAVYGEEAFTRDFGRITPVPEGRILVAEDGTQVDLNGRVLTFIDTPGHANHHGCIFDPRTRGLFTGDTFGIAYKELDTDQGPLLFAPTTPVAFDPEAWQRSLDRLMTLEPQVAFLTHFCQLDRPALHLETLRQGIRDLAALALREEDAPDEGRPARLEAAVDAYLLGRARANGCDLSDEQVRAVLAVDIKLNAQGLEIWLRRRAKANTAR